MRVREFLEDAFFEDLSMHTLSFKFNPSSSTRMPAAIQQQDAAVAEALPVKSIVFLSKNLLLQARKSDRSQFHVWLTTLFHPSTWPNFSQFKGFNFHWSFFRNYTKLGYRGYIKVGNRMVRYFSSFLAWLRVIHFFSLCPKFYTDSYLAAKMEMFQFLRQNVWRPALLLRTYFSTFYRLWPFTFIRQKHFKN